MRISPLMPSWSITAPAMRISSGLTRPSAFAMWPITPKVAVKKAAWARS